MSISSDSTDRITPDDQPDYARLSPGTMVANRYLLAQVLGSGGEGLVYAGVDTQLGAGVALKVSVYDDAESRARLQREARIGNLLGNDIQGVVRCLEWGELPERGLYIVQDIVDKAVPLDMRVGALEERLKRLEEAAELVAQVHARGVVHRDVKPANFLLDAKGTLFLTDFGLSKQIGEDEAEVEEDLTVKGRAMGTPAYMPLEQFQNARDVDYRADVYALGAMLYMALCGRPPFVGDSMKVLTLQVKANYEGKEIRPSQVVADVPSELDDLCAAALALDVDERLGSAKEFLERLRSSRGGSASETPVPSARRTRRTARPPKRERDPEVIQVVLKGETLRAQVTGFVDERRRLARLDAGGRPLLLRRAASPELADLEAALLEELAHPCLVTLLGRAQTKQGEVLVVEPTPPLPPAVPLPVALDFALDLLAGVAALHERDYALPELSRESLGIAFSPPSLRLPPPAQLVELAARGQARLVLSELNGVRSVELLRELVRGHPDPKLPAPKFLHLLAPPEVVERFEGRPAPQSDPRSADVYMAGHLLQDLLTRQSPYRGREGVTLRRLKQEEVGGRRAFNETAFARLPQPLLRLRALLSAMLSIHPRERPRIADALETVRAVCQAKPIETQAGQVWRQGLLGLD